MEPRDVERYLRKRVPEAKGLELVGLSRTYPGMSRETWLADTRWRQDGREVTRGFVLRMDTPGGSVVPTPLRREYEVYRRLDGTAVPVPRALWYEKNEDWDRAHEIVQGIPSEIGSAVHAYLHRKEGEYGNARYWYSRAGRDEILGPLDDEWDALAKEITAD